MTAATTFAIVIAPFIVAAVLAWGAQHRNSTFRPVSGSFDNWRDADARRISHELDAIRTHSSGSGR